LHASGAAGPSRISPTAILARDPEFLTELPESVQIHRIVMDRQGLR